jgi:transposase
MKEFRLTAEQLKILRRRHREARKKRQADRLKAVYLLGKGWSIYDVSEALLLDEDTLRNYIQRYQEGGIKALLKDGYKGSEGKLTEGELKELDAHLQEVTYLRVKDIVVHVKKEYEIEYTESGMTKLLKRLNFSYKKPKKVPGKANKEEQQKFLKKYRKIRCKMSSNDSLYFMDGVHPEHQPIIKCGWIKKGTEKEIKTTARQKRLNINGAVNIDTMDVVATFNKQLNEESTLDFLEKLRKKESEGKIYLICDRARYYYTDKIFNYAKSMCIEIIHLPPYSPNLNVIERLWQYFQKVTLHNHYYKQFNEFKSACKSFFANAWRHKNNLRSLLTENFETIGG